MDLQAWLDILWRRKWFLAFPLVVATSVAFLKASTLKPFYEAQALAALSATSGESSVLTAIGMRDISLRGGGRVSDTELPHRIALAKVRPLLSEVIWKLQIRDASGELETPARFVAVPRLSGRPSVRLDQVTSTQIVRLRARAPDPESAAMIANTLAELYIQENRRTRREEYARAREFVQDQLVKVRTDYVETLAEIRDFKVAQGSADLAAETQAAVNRLVELARAEEAAVVALAETRARETEARSQLEADARRPVPVATVGEDRHVELLRRMLADVETELAGALAEKKPGHPDVENLRRRAESLRDQVKAVTLLRQEGTPDLALLQREVAALSSRWTNLTQQVRAQTARLAQIPAKSYQEAQLELRHRVSRDLYNSLLQSLHQIGIAEAMTLSDIRLVEGAVPPNWNSPMGPSRMPMRLMGLFLGLTMGLGLAFVMERLDDSLKAPDEASQHSQLPVLGTIPRMKRGRPRLIWSFPPTDPVCESYRSLKNNLAFASPDKPIRKLLVTSPLASEGKTTTVANLGIAVAQDGKRVLLLDADLRRPCLHKIFELPNSAGVTTLLTGEGSKADVIRGTRTEGLHVLTSGPLPPDPGRLLESQKFQRFLDELSADYDLVIIDSPPALAVHDAVTLGALADGSLSVLELGRETRRALLSEKQLLLQGGVQPLGIVINKFRPPGFGYGTYGHYYQASRR